LVSIVIKLMETQSHDFVYYRISKTLIIKVYNLQIQKREI